MSNRTNPRLRAARPSDADALAALINDAGEGLPAHLWAKMAEPGETLWDVGRRRARRENGGFSYRNAVVLEETAGGKGQVVAALVGYRLPDEPEPIDRSETPAMFVPLLELENLVPGTWYVNVLAAFPEHRGRGHGTRLLAESERLARACGASAMSIIVTDTNTGARRLYERSGYREIARRRIVKEDWIFDGEEDLLLTKHL